MRPYPVCAQVGKALGPCPHRRGTWFHYEANSGHFIRVHCLSSDPWSLGELAVASAAAGVPWMAGGLRPAGACCGLAGPQAQAPPHPARLSSVSSHWTPSRPAPFIIHFQLGCSLWTTPASKAQSREFTAMKGAFMSNCSPLQGQFGLLWLSLPFKGWVLRRASRKRQPDPVRD